MTAAYYNEFDPYAAQWLRNLIAAGHIAPGDVDERSITDVSVSDLIGYKQCHFFAGIGGWSLAARLAGWPDERPLWTGSCPCQPFSVAGKGAGQDDARHLWPDFFRLIRAGRPDVVMGEQVAAAVGKDWLDGVLADLEGIGYVGGAAVVPACAVNAPHRRDRLWFVAGSRVLGDSQRAGLEGLTGHDRAASGRTIEDRSTAEAGCGGNVADSGCSERRTVAEGRHVDHGADAGREETAGRLAIYDSFIAGGDVADSDSLAREQRSSVERRGNPGGCAQSWAGLGSDDSRRGDVADSDQSGSYASAHEGLHCRQEGPWPRHVEPVGYWPSWDGANWILGHDGKARRVEPGIRLLVDGFPVGLAGSTAGSQTKSRQVALKGFGNAIVPEVAAEVMAAWMEVCP